ncbi:MAG: glucose-1-phosphate cytidylyltransferase [Flavobacteriales bacterium]|nr:glucose-1-phosphate cytidylyltransferase [Flavobacteriales bacterium]
MKVVILAGGLGTRLSEETHSIPKPMVTIGDKPIIWHIMKIYSSYGYNDFVILLGYKGYVIKEYFANYFLHQNDVTIDLSNNSMEILNQNTEPWKITLLDTGANTMIGGRIKRAKEHIGNKPFLLTYGDGVSDVNIDKLVNFHKEQNKTVTVTAVQPEGRFGALQIDNGSVSSFQEKPKGDGAWINGGFFVCEPKVIDYIEDDSTVFEREPLEKLASENKLAAFQHTGFWHAMDTMRDKNLLESYWNTGEARWKSW